VDSHLANGKAWDKFGTKIVSMRFISVHFDSLTVRLQPEYNVMVISNFQFGSLFGHPTENPCVGGSIPSLATSKYNNLQVPYFLILANVPDIVPDTLHPPIF
jgi:hypothetical protein